MCYVVSWYHWSTSSAGRYIELSEKSVLSSLWALPSGFVSTWSQVSLRGVQFTPTFPILCEVTINRFPGKCFAMLGKLDVCFPRWGVYFPTVEIMGPRESSLCGAVPTWGQCSQSNNVSPALSIWIFIQLCGTHSWLWCISMFGCFLPRCFCLWIVVTWSFHRGSEA